MHYNVAGLLKESSGYKSMETVDEIFFVEEMDRQADAFGKLVFIRTDKGIWVSGEIVVLIELDCGACLNKFEFQSQINLEEEFIPYIDMRNNSIIHVQKEEGNFRIDSDNLIDLEEAMSQYTFMKIPFSPRCTVQCKGLCVKCGVDLNTNNCDCNTKQIDSRWAPLESSLDSIKE